MDRSRTPGESLRDIDLGPEMVIVPSGQFVMGAPEDEIGSTGTERPQHSVIIASAFAIGKYPVTFDEWEAAARKGGTGGYRGGNWGTWQGITPIVDISWNDCQLYLEWLSRATGKQYRLLTEAEWEYACRAGTTTPFATGTSITQSEANFDGFNPTPVGSFQPNRFGLYDMHGNVWEWVQDNWHHDYIGAPADGSAWMTPGSGRHVIRGGAWFIHQEHIRSAARTFDVAHTRRFNYGFRVARAL
jgi:formylglycine-generating enzyme required for sulfatase activity